MPKEAPTIAPVSDQAATPTEEAPLAFRAVRGGLWMIASSYWTIGFGFASNIVLTRLLPPEAFGNIALAAFFVSLLQLQPKLGLGYAFAQRKDTTGEVLGTYIPLEITAALGGLLLSVLAIPVLQSLGYTLAVAQVSAALAMGALMDGVAGVGILLLEKELHFDQTSLIRSVVFPISYIPAFWLAFRGGGVWSLVSQTVTYAALLMLATWWAAWRKLPHLRQLHWQFNPALAHQFLHFGITVGIGNMGAVLTTQLDNFMIGTYVSVTVLGFYDRAYRTAQWPSTLLNSLTTRVAFLTYAKLQADLVRLQKTVMMVVWLTSTLALPLALVIFVGAPDLITLLYGERWLPSVLFVRILVIYSVVRPIWENAGSLFIAIGKPRITTQLVIVQLVTLAVVGLPLTLIWGAVGTCAAVGLAFAVGLVLIYYHIRTLMPFRFGSVLGWPVLISLLVLFGYLGLSRLTPLQSLAIPIRLAIKCLYTAIAFSGLTLLLQPAATCERIRYIWRLAVQSGRR